MTSIDDILKEHVFPEPRLVFFEDEDTSSGLSQLFVVAEKSLILEVTSEASVLQGLCALIAVYYVFLVNYPKSVPASFVCTRIPSGNIPLKDLKKCMVLSIS